VLQEAIPPKHTPYCFCCYYWYS